MNRADRAEKAGIPLKKAKMIEPCNTDDDDATSEDYDRHMTKLNTDYKSGKWTVSSLSCLMEETYMERRKFLKANLPIPEALEKFPWLCEPQLVCL